MVRNAIAVGTLLCVAGSLIGVACIAYATVLAANIIGF